MTSDECRVRIEAFGPFLIGDERPPGPHQVVHVDFTELVDERDVQDDSLPVIELVYELDEDDDDITVVDQRPGAGLSVRGDEADKKEGIGHGR